LDTSVAKAHAVLESRIRRNKVRQDYMANMRHEKKGVKRRRLESERWKRRFADHVRRSSRKALF
jgi:small subunit ribosomal protein MRP21